MATFPPLGAKGLLLPSINLETKATHLIIEEFVSAVCLGKLFTSILNNRLKKHILQLNTLHPAQIGLLPKHRTSDDIFTLRTLVDKYVINNPKEKLYTCFIDFKKAFDSVWHDNLYYKLLQHNKGSKFYDLIKNLYSKSKCCIKINDKRTEFSSCQKGVRQGCILSRILFNLYLNDVPFILDRDDTDPIILPNGTRLNSLLYADDLVLISKSAHGLQKALSILAKFCNEWLLSINPKKTKVMIFQKKCRKSTLNKYCFNINHKSIEIVNNYTYLGVNFSSCGSFRDCKTNLKEKARRPIFATRRYLNFLKLPLEVTSKLFDSLSFPILLYGSEIWGIYDKNNLSTWEKDEIEKTHIYFCKQAMSVNKQCPNVAVRNEIGRKPLKLNIDTSIIKFWVHLQNLSENDIAKQ